MPNRVAAGRKPRWLPAALLLANGSLAALDRDVVISVYQGPCREGDFPANLAAARKVVAEARDRGAHFVVFPECFLSGYESREAVAAGARPVDDRELQGFIAESAGHDAVVVAGLARKAPDGLYNSALAIHRGRLLGIYDKVMLTGGDRDALGFRPGRAVPVLLAHGARFAVIICHDSSFPHAAMAARLQGAEILFSPHYNEIGAAAADDHRRWVRNCHVGLACQLKMAVARANIVKTGRPGAVSYGDSFILDPGGSPIAEAGLFKTGLIAATITPAMFRAPRVWADLEEAPGWLRAQVADLLAGFRRPAGDAELRFWLENMLVHHRFTDGEASAATGLTPDEVAAAARRLGLTGKSPAPRSAGDPIRVLPYPGGRHPRIGFLDGAIAPQRDTKVSVFLPWDGAGYAVADVPEAIWSNLGLTYLAHTHLGTIWTERGVKLPPLEWNRRADGTLDFERVLPNGIAFGTRVEPASDAVRMEMWLRNGTGAALTDLRVQNCVMLKGAPGFAAQTLENKVFSPPYAAARSADGRRWIIAGWDPIDRAWGNHLVPCLHADPKFPDCPPGETVRLRGGIWFYEGGDLPSELKRLEATGWRRR